MEMIFLKLLNMSITASWLILAVLLLRTFLKAAPKWAICVLWGIAALRLVCPFSLRMPLSLIPNAEVLDMDMVQYAQNPTVNTGISFLNRALNPVISRTFESTPGASVNPLYIWIFLGGIVWVVGCMFLLGYGLTDYLRLHKMVQERVPLAVYWFNPLVWAAYWFFCRDLELSCDEKVIRNFDMNEKKAYANALVSCSMQQNWKRP